MRFVLFFYIAQEFIFGSVFKHHVELVSFHIIFIVNDLNEVPASEQEVT
jgi:hypothetical protein